MAVAAAHVASKIACLELAHSITDLSLLRGELPFQSCINPDKRTVFRIDDVKMWRRMFIRKKLYLHSVNDSDRGHLVSCRNSILETSNQLELLSPIHGSQIQHQP